MSQLVGDSLHEGREAIRRHEWRRGFELLAAADRSEALAPPDLEGLAEAAWWTGHPDECIAARERAYAAYTAAGNKGSAARVALLLAWDQHARNAPSVATGWLSRSERVLEGESESPEHGWLAEAQAFFAIDTDPDGALDLAKKALDIGTRFGDRELQALGIHVQGRVLVMKGDVEQGLSLLDEALVAAVSGELGPHATGVVYCSTIHTCATLADYRRAAEWTDAAERWCRRQSINGFPGLCRVHRAEIMRLRGAWPDAEREARQACDELKEYFVFAVGWGLYEIGEIRLRMGDFRAADEAFREAYEAGKVPQPGLALLRLAEGRLASATASIRRALADESMGRLERARLLPAQVEIALAADDLATARSAASELEGIAGGYGSVALHAAAGSARGMVLLAEGDPLEAERSLRRGCRLWQEVDVPYEVARVRTLLGRACREQGDEDAALLELQASRSTFRRLGAIPDARVVEELMGTAANGHAQPAGPRTTKTFMFTDIVKSTNLVEAMGDEAWEHLLRWHDQELGGLFAAHAGEVVNRIGDGFFVAFESPGAAIDCAVEIQRALTQHRREHGFSPQVRIGIHEAEATRNGRDYQGRGVHQAARIGALAEGGEILVSAASLPDGSRHSTSDARSVTLKGIAEPVELVAVAWR